MCLVSSCVSCCVVYINCVLTIIFFVCFFFKQKTAYEMRISDWSSDVCSSDLMDSRLRGNDRFVQAQPLTVRFPSPPEWARRRSPPDRYDAGTARTVRAPYHRAQGEPPERPAPPTPPRQPAPRSRPSPPTPAPFRRRPALREPRPPNPTAHNHMP